MYRPICTPQPKIRTESRGKSVFVQSAERSKTIILSKYGMADMRTRTRTPFETVVEVRGSALHKILSEFYKDAKDMRLSEDPPVVTPQLLYHAATELRLRKREEEAVLPIEKQDHTLTFELDAALTFINGEFALVNPRIETLVRNNEVTSIPFGPSFPPNELVFTMDELSEPTVYRALYHRISEEGVGDRILSLVITCSFVD